MASLQSELPQQDPLVDVHNPNHYKVGTLSYTKLGLVSLFAFLLWGDFCWQLMETVMPSVLPLKFADIHADNWEVGLIMATIPSLMTRSSVSRVIATAANGAGAFPFWRR
jgi:hypothetical protein